MTTTLIHINQIDRISDSNHNKGNIDQNHVTRLVDSYMNGESIGAIIVRQYETRNRKIYYEVISGQHRYTAKKEYLSKMPLVRPQIECIIRNDLTDAQAYELSVRENFHRLRISKYNAMKTCTDLYKKGNSFNKIKEMTGIDDKTVSKYVYMYYFLHRSLHPYILDKKGKKDSLTFDLCRDHLINFDKEFQVEVFSGIKDSDPKDHEAVLRDYERVYPGKYKKVTIVMLKRDNANQPIEDTSAVVIPQPVVHPTQPTPQIIVESISVRRIDADTILISNSGGSVTVKQDNMSSLINSLQNVVKK